MIKTFKADIYIDNTWTGLGIREKTNYLDDIDVQINKHAKENRLVVVKVDYSIVNKNIQHGTADFNVERIVSLLAAVCFRKSWISIFRLT